MPDELVRALESILARARRAEADLEQGHATTGASALAKIVTEADDALRHHAEDLAAAAGEVRFAHSV